MNKLILTTAIGLSMLATPVAAADGTMTPGASTVGDQRTFPGADRSRSYDRSPGYDRGYDNSNPATADPHLGPQGGSDDGGGAGSDGDGAGAGSDGAGGDGAGAGAGGGDGAGGAGGGGSDGG